MQLTLTVIAGPYAGQSFRCDRPDRYFVGRSPKAHFRLRADKNKDLLLSRMQFLIDLNPPQCRLHDLGSRNGTKVNGQKVTSHDLVHGDEIRAGETVLRVAIREEAPLPQTIREEANLEALSLAAAERIDAICVRFEENCKAGRRPRLEEFLEGVPASDEAALRQELLRLESHYRRLQGKTPLPASPVGKMTPSPAVTRPSTVSLPARGLCPCCGGKTPETAAPACAGCLQQAREQPQPVPGYLLLRRLGRGAMGIVFLALRAETQQLVAVKTIRPEGLPQPGQIERFLREANILRELNHTYIVGFHEMGDAEGVLPAGQAEPAGGQFPRPDRKERFVWFAMDYVCGTDAARLLQQRGPLSIRTAASIASQLLKALDHAHGRQFIHRDVKPANVLLETHGRRMHVKVADFGLARKYQESGLSGLTGLNEIGGTLEFMPPEQITHFREAGPEADQFSAAATLYTLLTGKFIRELSGPLAKRVDQVLADAPTPIRKRRSDLPGELARVIHRALEMEPERRYASVRDFLEALKPFVRPG